MQNYKDLRVYQKSYRLTLDIYKVAKTFPKEEMYALSSQIKRAAYSIPLNIAEGYAKKSSAQEFKRFLMMALGSSDEMSVILDLVRDLGFISTAEYDRLTEGYTEVGKMLNKMQQVWGEKSRN